MGTRSRIGLLNEKTNIVTSIYCHWDGYPEGVGEVLVTSYVEVAKIRRLLKMGDLSSLGSQLSPRAGDKHTFQTPADNVCVFYKRDRDEKGCLAKKCRPENFREISQKCGAEYSYLFVPSENKWITSQV